MTDDTTVAANGSTTPLALSKDMIGDDSYVTVVTASKPIGKRIFRDADGYAKEHINDSGRFTARRHRVTLDSLADLIVTLESNQALIRGYIPVRAMETYHIAPRREIEAVLPEGMDPRQYGIRDDTGTVVVARLKDLFAPSRFVLFEHDPHAETPPSLRVNDAADLLAKLAVLHPPFKDVGYISYPSSSNRVHQKLMGAPALPSGAMHTLVEVDDAANIEAFATALYERAWVEGMGYRIPNKVGAPLRRTVFDNAVFHPNGLVFSGRPTADGPGLHVVEPTVTRHAGNALDMSGLERPSADELSAAMGVTVQQGKGSTHRVLLDLTPAMEIDTEDGTMTVQEFMDSDATHVRCQATFRQSASEAAFLSKHQDGTPFLFDQGAQESHKLAAPEPLAKLAAALMAQQGSDPGLFRSISDVVLKPTEYLAKPLIPAMANGLLFGLPESFKSFVLIGLGLAVARGDAEWMGYPLKRGGDVLYVCGEGEAGIRARVEAWLLEHGATIDDVRRFHISKMPMDFCKPKTVEDIHADIVERGLTPRIIMVDTYSANSSGEENDNNAISDFLKNLRMLQLVHSCLVLVAHHPGHGEQTRVRGASAWGGNIDVTFQIERQGEEFDRPRPMGTVLTPGKTKDGSKGEPLGLLAVEKKIGLDADGDDVTSLVLVPDASVVRAAAAKHEHLLRGVLRILLAAPSTGQEKIAAELVARKFCDREPSRDVVRDLLKKAEQRNLLKRRRSGGGDVTPTGEVWCKLGPFESESVVSPDAVGP